MSSFENAKRSFGSTARDDDIYVEHGITNIECDIDQDIMEDDMLLTQ